MTKKNATVEDLKAIPAFQNVPADQLAWLVQHGSVECIPAGGYVFQRGDEIDKMQIILKGSADIKIEQNGEYKLVGSLVEKEITGFLPFSRATTALGFGVAKKDCEVFTVSKSCLREMSLLHFELTEALVHRMTSRTRELTQLNQQQEKMMALGKLSAGLAHELNNPASAISRSAKELRSQLGHVPEKFKRLMTMRATLKEVEIINDILFEKISQVGNHTISMMERSTLEDSMENWLEQKEVENAFDFVDTLVDYNITIDDLKVIYTATGDTNFASAIEWIENVLTTEKLVVEINEAADRISGIVHSVKGYSHMDSAAEKQSADIHLGINNTLTLLNHKIKVKSLEISKIYDPTLAQPRIMIGEMNQVWTNIIDNAIDAVTEKGKIEIKTKNDGNYVKVMISDNGKGIPKEHLSKIFDPFFTTKPVGQGTGLGLEVTYRIIAQHRGKIEVSSTEGKTTFTVILPVN